MPWHASPRPSRTKHSPQDSLLGNILSSLNPSGWGLFPIVVILTGGVSCCAIAIGLHPMLTNWGLSYVAVVALSFLLTAPFIFLMVRLAKQTDSSSFSGKSGQKSSVSQKAPVQPAKTPITDRKPSLPSGVYVIRKQRDHSYQPPMGGYMAPVIKDNPILAWQMSRLTGQSHISFSTSPKQPPSPQAWSSTENQSEKDGATL